MPRFVTALAAAPSLILPSLILLGLIVPGLIAHGVHAHGAASLEGNAIAQALTGATLVYEDGSSQSFYASGKTLYQSGTSSWGNWTTRDDQYCSQWPPSADWACYTVRLHHDQIEFVGPSGDVTSGIRQ